MDVFAVLGLKTWEPEKRYKGDRHSKADLRFFAILCYQVDMDSFSGRYWFYFHYGSRSHWRKG
jgi:hypothetical protein